MAILSLIAIGCANSGSDYRVDFRQAQVNPRGGGSFNSPDAEDDYSCPTSSNVSPDYDRWLDGSMYFQVCKHADSAYKILIHGKTRGNDTICVYPAQYVDQTHVYLKPTIGQPSMPLHQCTQVAEAGVFADFDLVNYNAVFIVEKQDEAQMSACLAGGNYGLCPVYSYGRFR